MELLRCKRRFPFMGWVEVIRLSRLMSQLRGLMLSIQSRSPISLQSPEPPLGTVESASMEIPTIDAKSSRSFLLKSKASIFATMLEPGGLVGEPLEVTSDCEQEDEYCNDEVGDPVLRSLKHLLLSTLLLLLLLLCADNTGSMPPVRAVAEP